MIRNGILVYMEWTLDYGIRFWPYFGMSSLSHFESDHGIRVCYNALRCRNGSQSVRFGVDFGMLLAEPRN